MRYFTSLRFSRNLSQITTLPFCLALLWSVFFLRIAWVTSPSIHGGDTNLRVIRLGIKVPSLSKRKVFQELQSSLMLLLLSSELF